MVKPSAYRQSMNKSTTGYDLNMVKRANMWFVREQLYRDTVLTKSEIRLPSIKQLCAMHMLMVERRVLTVTVAEMLRDGVYSYYRHNTTTIHNVFYQLEDKGILFRSSRDSRNERFQRGRVATWGITKAGMRLLAEYYAYMEGLHDVELPVSVFSRLGDSA